MTQVIVTVNGQGRLVVPAELRRDLDIRPGSSLVAYVDDGRLIMEKRDHLIRRLQDEFVAAGDGRSVVDEMIADRRAEAAAESD